MISSPAHTINQLGEETAIIVPVINVEKNKVVEGRMVNIKEGKEFNLSKFRLEV